jgi:alkanesulfonate monooxygenase SsuD/methylene tetrahydromethanopterin reductase-like flavin-dependent oxidoreductase (luciferase family)
VELGVYSFGNVQRRPDGSLASTAEAIRDLVEVIKLADEVGLDYFGVGEHHTRAMPVSPITVIAAAAAVTTRIGLGTTVSVLSTDDPVRVYQQHATASAVSSGRVDLTAGRGSSTDSFPLFGYDLSDYDRLYAERLDLLLAINAKERVTWRGTVRPPLADALVVPRVEGGLKIWLGTGGNPGSSVRAGMLGLPIAYGILGGSISDWVQRADLYRRALADAGHAPHMAEIAVASHGFVAADGIDAKDRFFRYESEAFAAFAGKRGIPVRSRPHFDADTAPGGMIFAGGPSEIADRLITFHRAIGHSRHLIQMDLGPTPQRELLAAVELLGTEVAPLVRKELARTEVPSPGPDDRFRPLA